VFTARAEVDPDMNDKTFLCPRCAFPLIPVHAVERGRRRFIALTCPEPYCDHMQMLTPKAARELEAQHARRGAERRQISGTG
jgi:hypothetical protein